MTKAKKIYKPTYVNSQNLGERAQIIDRHVEYKTISCGEHASKAFSV